MATIRQRKSQELPFIEVVRKGSQYISLCNQRNGVTLSDYRKNANLSVLMILGSYNSLLGINLKPAQLKVLLFMTSGYAMTKSEIMRISGTTNFRYMQNALLNMKERGLIHWQISVNRREHGRYYISQEGMEVVKGVWKRIRGVNRQIGRVIQ